MSFEFRDGKSLALIFPVILEHVDRSCGECGMIQDCGFCFFDDPAQGAVNGTCLMSRENMTEFTSDYGPCSTLSSSVSQFPTASACDANQL